MNFTQFHEIFLQQGCYHFKLPNGPKYENTDKTWLDRVVMAKQGYNAKFRLKTCLEHGFAIEYTYYQWL